MNLVALPEAAKVVMGQSPPSSTYNTKGEGLPFFQGKADFGDLYPTARVFCTEPQRIAEAGDILISVRAPVGPTNLNPHRSCIGRGLAAIRPIVDTDTKYLLYFLRYYEPELAQAGTGSTFEAVSRDDIESIRVPLPPLPEQQRIAAILARADRLRRLRRYALELSEGYLQAVFVEMFGDPVRNLALRLEPLGELCIKITDGTHVTPKYLPAGVPFLSVKNLTKDPGTIDFSDVKYISRDEHEKISKACDVRRGDILYTKVGTYGIAQIVDTDIEFSIFVSVAMLRPDRHRIDPKYLEAALRTAFIKRQADSLVSGIGVPDLHLREIKTIQVPVPPITDQHRFVEIIRKHERLRAQQREAARQAEQLFGALLDRAFRGEL